MARAELGTARGMDRLIFFTDAVTAIAITLLILPLVDLVPKYAGMTHPSVGAFLNDNLGQIFAFVLSFVIIARFWMSNHQLLERAERPTLALMWLNVAWAFTIVVLPLPTEISAVFSTSRLVLALYLGTMAANSLLLTGIALELYRRPELESEDSTRTLIHVWNTGVTSATFVVALILALTIPHLSYYALLLLLLDGPLTRFVSPRIRRREAARRESETAV